MYILAAALVKPSPTPVHIYINTSIDAWVSARKPGLNSSGYALEAVGLVKSYGDVLALRGLTLRVRPGEIYGLIGPNGAGKTTTLKIVAGLLRPDAGSVRIYGIDLMARRYEALRLIGYVPENPYVFRNLTVTQFIRMAAALRGINWHDVRGEAERLLEVFGLQRKKDVELKKLSRGMLQKTLAIACFIVNPKLMVMDEPMAGMDPEAQHAFKEEVRRMTREEEAAAVVSSHILDMVERFCTRVGLIKNGRLIFEGSVEELKEAAAAGTLEDAFLRLIRGGGG